MNTKRIYKLSMAEYLIDNNANLIKVVNDAITPNHKNWLFEDTPELKKLMTEFTEGIRAHQ